jgi:hypothetical protein
MKFVFDFITQISKAERLTRVVYILCVTWGNNQHAVMLIRPILLIYATWGNNQPVVMLI